MTRIAWLLVGVLPLTACSDGDNPGPRPSSPASAVSSPSSAPSVTDCGTFQLDQGEELDASAVTCLITAVSARQPARLIVTRPTVEGDPVPTTYVAEDDGSVEVTTDGTQDRFGDDIGFQVQICTGPRLVNGVLDFATCTDAGPSRG